MNLKDLIARFRVAADDEVETYRWTDKKITMWLNDAVAEAAVRGRLLLESSLAGICRIAAKEGQSTYQLHPALYEITHLSYACDGASEPQQLDLVSTEWLDRNQPGWRHKRMDRVRWAVQSEGAIRLVPAPPRDGLIMLEGYRLPLSEMRSGADVPEIHAFSHDKLVLWALYRGFSQPDSAAFDPTRAELSEREFTKYFGRRPDSDMRRETREDVPHVTESIIL